MINNSRSQSPSRCMLVSHHLDHATYHSLTLSTNRFSRSFQIHLSSASFQNRKNRKWCSSNLAHLRCHADAVTKLQRNNVRWVWEWGEERRERERERSLKKANCILSYVHQQTFTINKSLTLNHHSTQCH